MIDVLLLAPYASVRAGLRVLLGESLDINVAGEARDVTTLTYLLESLQPHAILYDAGADALPELLDALAERELPIIALCDDSYEVSLLAARSTAAWSALGRSAGGDAIAEGVRATVAGLICLDPDHAHFLLDEGARFGARNLPSGDPEATLTPRESEVLQLMARGLPNKNIAARLQISLSTAKFHVASILAKLNAASRTEAVTIGARRGLVTL